MAKAPPPVRPLKYLSNRRLMMPIRASSPAISCRMYGVKPAPMSFPFRSVGPLPASSSAAASRCPDRCAGTSSVPYVVVPPTTNETSRLTAATARADERGTDEPGVVLAAPWAPWPELHAASPEPSKAAMAAKLTVRLRARMSLPLVHTLAADHKWRKAVVVNPGELAKDELE